MTPRRPGSAGRRCSRSPSRVFSSTSISTAAPISSPRTATWPTISTGCSRGSRMRNPRTCFATPAADGGGFEDSASAAGAALAEPIVGRGAAYADVDNDGDLDLLVATNHGRARLLRNDGGNRHHALRVKLLGTTSNRDGIGARVDIALGAGRTQWQLVKTGSSYCSQSELPLTFGLGDATRVNEIRVRLPSGRVETIAGADAD